MYLKRLEEQQRHVLEIIANKRAMYGSARLSGSRTGLSASRERTHSNLAPALGTMSSLRESSTLGEGMKKVPLPKTMGIQPQTSRKVLLQAQRSLEERRAAPAVAVPVPMNDDADIGPGTSLAMDIHRALPPIRTRVPDEGEVQGSGDREHIFWGLVFHCYWPPGGHNGLVPRQTHGKAWP
jgi:hypothetical protein